MELEARQIIIRPLITEKSTHLSEKRPKGKGGTYCFQVHRDANKIQIKQAVEKIYNVKVLDVRTVNVKGKRRRFRFFESTTPSWKKAYVTLHPDHHIDLF